MKKKASRGAARPFYTEAEQQAVNEYLEGIRLRLALSAKHTALMLLDFDAAVRYYKTHGRSVREAIAMLSPDRLGDFYIKERTDWYPLDHAAKIYPLSMSLTRMMVFRMSCYLKEPVVPEMMQVALNYTMTRFPYFATTIKCGFFWHYVDSAMRRFPLRAEYKLPCSVMRLNAYNSPSLRVVYFKNRVSVEFFHILTDGMGASVFLKTLVAEYLRLLGHEIGCGEGVLSLASAPDPREWADDFITGDQSPQKSGFADKRAVQLRGMPAYEKPCRVLHYNMSVEKLRALSKRRGVTITTLMLGYIFAACKKAAYPAGRKRIQIQLPVNMRKFYPSQTLRNFSMYCSIRLRPDEITTPEEAMLLIAPQVSEGGKKENLDKTIALSRRLVKLLRLVPLIIKRPLAYLIYGTLSDGVFTLAFSNMGAITAPPGMAEHVDKFDFVLGPPVSNKAAISLCSYGNRAVLTLTKITNLTTFDEALYDLLKRAGLEPYMEGSN